MLNRLYNLANQGKARGCSNQMCIFGGVNRGTVPCEARGRGFFRRADSFF